VGAEAVVFTEEAAVVVFSLALGPLPLEAVAGGSPAALQAALAVRAGVLRALVPANPAAAPPVVDQVFITAVRDLRPGGAEVRFRADDPINTAGNAFGTGESDADVFDFLLAQRAAIAAAIGGGGGGSGGSGSGARRLLRPAAAAPRAAPRRAAIDSLPLLPPKSSAPRLGAGDAASPNLAFDFNVFTPGDEAAMVASLSGGALLPPDARANITSALEVALSLPPGNLTMAPAAAGVELATVAVARKRWAILWDWLRRQKAGPIAAALALALCVPVLYAVHRRCKAARVRARAAAKAAAARNVDALRAQVRSKAARWRGAWRRVRTKVAAAARFIVLARAVAMAAAESRAVAENARKVAAEARQRVAGLAAAASAAAEGGGSPAGAGGGGSPPSRAGASPPSRSTRAASVFSERGGGAGGGAGGGGGGPSPPSFIARGFEPVARRGGGAAQVHPRFAASPYGASLLPPGARASRAASTARGVLAGLAESGESPPAARPSPSRAGRGGAPTPRPSPSRGGGGGRGAPSPPAPPASPAAVSPVMGAPPPFFDDSKNLDARGRSQQLLPPSSAGSAAARAPAHRGRASKKGDSGIPLPAPVGRASPFAGSEAPSLPGSFAEDGAAGGEDV